MGLFDAVAGLFDPTSGLGLDTLSTASDILGSTLDVGQLPSSVNYVSYPTYSAPAYMGGYETPPGGAPPLGQAGAAPMLVSQSNQSVMLQALGIPQILFQIAQHLGLNRMPSLRTVMKWIGRMSKFLSPALVATALGIEIAQLANLITASSKKKRRRMNVANIKALRRGVRRLEGFDRMACKVQAALGARASRRSARRRCHRCKKSPCTC